MSELVVQAQIDSLREISQFVCRVGRAAGLGANRLYQLRLAVDEIASNIIQHGYDGGDDEALLRLTVSQGENCLHILLEDQGRPFDPAALPPLNLHLPPEERPIGGLGLYLAHWSVDEVHFDHSGDANRTTLIVNYMP